MEIKILDTNLLCPHECILKNNLEKIEKQIFETGVVDYPIIVDKKSLTILDGHHRYTILKKHGKKVPAILVDYFDEKIHLFSWRKGENYTKDDILAHSQNGILFPPKTTKHTYDFEIQKINFKLENL